MSEGVAIPATELWFREAMRSLGHDQFVLETRQAAGQYERLPDMAAELVRLPVDVLWTNGSFATQVAQQATRSIPIVMVSADALGSGIVSNLARPGGNVTGLSLVGTDLIHKRLELLKELSPRASKVLALGPGPGALALPIVKSWWNEVRKAAQALDLSARYAELDADSARWDEQFAGFAREMGTVVSPIESPFLLQQAERLAQLTLRHRLPAVYAFSQHVQAGGLCSYGVSLKYTSTRVAFYVSRILRGARAGELPVELPKTYELAINASTATALGLRVSRQLRMRVDVLVA